MIKTNVHFGIYTILENELTVEGLRLQQHMFFLRGGTVTLSGWPRPAVDSVRRCSESTTLSADEHQSQPSFVNEEGIQRYTELLEDL